MPAGFDRVFPRAWVELLVIFDDGEQVAYGQAPGMVEVSHNNHTSADTASCTVDLSAISFGHRTINNIFGSVFLGLVDTVDAPVKARETLQFCGYADHSRDRRGADVGTKVEVHMRDLSAPFRDVKPLVAKRLASGKILDPTPRFSDTVRSAIERIQEWVGLDSDVLALSDPEGLADIELGAAVSKRERTSYLPIKRDASAWDAMEHVAALAGVLLKVQAGNMVLRAPQSIIGQDKDGKARPTAYRFIYGTAEGNTLSVEREKKYVRNRKGIKVVGFDPKSHSSFAAVWPPDNALPPKHRPRPQHTRHSAKPRKPAQEPKPPDRDIYSFGLEGLTSPDAALAIAKAIYINRSSQELEGKLSTKNWSKELLALRNGDRIGVRVSQRVESDLRNFDDDARKIDFLRNRMGIDEKAARLLLRGTRREEDEAPMYLRSIHHKLSTMGGKADLETNVDFINLMVL